MWTSVDIYLLGVRAELEPSRGLMFHHDGEGPYSGLHLVESTYISAFTFKTVLRHYANQPQPDPYDHCVCGPN